jgi:hypothetical protein
MIEELVYFNYGVGALPAKRARMYCCSGYRITPNQGGTRFYSSFQRFVKEQFLAAIRAKADIPLFTGFHDVRSSLNFETLGLEKG